MKKLILLFVLLGGISFAQRDISSTMFWNNYTNINPAMSGLEYHLHVSIHYRNQWPALSNSSHTTFTNFSMRLGDKHGVGINYTNESYAIWKKNDLTANYNYQIKLGQVSRLSLGVAASYFNSRENLGQLTFVDTPPTSSYNFNDVNANIGAAFTWKKLLVQGSVTNIFNSLIKTTVSSIFYGNRSFYLGAAYELKLGKRFAVKPQLLGQYTNKFIRLNLNAQFSFDNKYWVGASIGARNNFAFMAGGNLYNKFRLAYSFDKTVSNLSNTPLGGSHEVSIGYFLK